MSTASFAALDSPEHPRHLRAERGFFNQGLFSNHYLSERLEAENAAWRELAAAMPAARTQLVAAFSAGAAGQDCDTTMAVVVAPLLRLLGWQSVAQPAHGQLDLRIGNTTVALCHVLPWAAPLEATPSHPAAALAPDLQLIGRMAGEPAVPWGILTNGRSWRLIARQAASLSGAYYEIDLGELLAPGVAADRDLRWFIAFFGAAWLQPQGDQPGLLATVYQRGQAWAEQIGSQLQTAIIEHVFVDLANALAEGVRHSGSPADLPTLYDATLVLLYRVLFLLYAESRQLLPLTNPSYYPHSLTHLLTLLALQQHNLLPTTCDFSLQPADPRLWQRLQALCNALASGQPDWHVPRYPGGLFASDTSAAHALLAQLTAVANDSLVAALDRLARSDETRRATNQQAALRLIDYADLDVRLLGSIYEGLLAYQLRQADQPTERRPTAGKRRTERQPAPAGALYLAATHQDRKASGTYYTPDHIVRTIIEQALGPLLEQRAQQFGALIGQLSAARATQHRDRVSALEEAASAALLDLKVLDPAMGSGHFLVAAVNYLSDQLSAILQRHATNLLRPRLNAVGTAACQQQSDRVLLRRIVAKHCIYGVDLNAMAVELAKLSVWLTAGAGGAPHCFLDHHLRCGNSLIGVWDVAAKLQPTAGPWRAYLRALRATRQITQLSDRSAAELQQSMTLYRRAQAALRPLRERCNERLARQVIGGTQAPTEAAEQRFFHWQLEFPEVFGDPEHSGWQTSGAAGFDAVVGNPPYDILRRSAEQPAFNRAIEYIRQEPGFAAVLSPTLNLFQLMMKRAISLASSGASISMIIPLAFLSDCSSAGIRRVYLTESRIEQLQAFPQKDDPRQRVFQSAKLSTLFFVTRTGSPTEVLRYRVHPGRAISASSPEIVIPTSSIQHFDPQHFTIPIGTPDEARLLARFYTERCFLPFGAAFQVTVGEIDMTLDRDCVAAQPGAYELLKGAHLQRFAQRTQPKQGVREWVDINRFKRKYHTTAKAHGHKHARIACQAITGTDDLRRLKATCIPPDHFLANSLNYLSPIDTNTDILLSLALINSRLLEWRFRRTSTNNNVNNYEIRALPFRRIHFSTAAAQRATLTAEVWVQAQALIADAPGLAIGPGPDGWPRFDAAAYRASALGQRLDALLPQDAQGRFCAWTAGASGAGEQSDVVHDLLARLAAQMIDLNRQQQAEVARFLRWVEAQLAITSDQHGRSGIDSLASKTTLLHYQGDYQKGEEPQPWERFMAVLAKPQNRRRYAGDAWQQGQFRSQLQDAYAHSLGLLLPIRARLARTDALIDQVVYQLYGLTTAEIAVVEGS